MDLLSCSMGRCGPCSQTGTSLEPSPTSVSKCLWLEMDEMYLSITFLCHSHVNFPQCSDKGVDVDQSAKENGQNIGQVMMAAISDTLENHCYTSRSTWRMTGGILEMMMMAQYRERKTYSSMMGFSHSSSCAIAEYNLLYAVWILMPCS